MKFLLLVTGVACACALLIDDLIPQPDLTLADFGAKWSAGSRMSDIPIRYRNYTP